MDVTLIACRKTKKGRTKAMNHRKFGRRSIGAVAVAALATAVALFNPTPWDDPVETSLTAGIDLSGSERAPAAKVAQTLSPYCQTPQGVCTLPSAMPIGSPCSCDGISGTIVP